MKRLYPELYAYLHSGKFDDFETHSLKVTKFIYGGGYCLACNTRTNIWSGKGFYEFCNKTCASKVRTYGEQNKLNLDEEQVRKMYVDDKMSPKAIGEVLNCSHVSVLKVVTELGIKRTHSEQQKLHNVRKGQPAINAGNFDREKLYNMAYITKENETKSIALIARDIGCSEGMIRVMFKRSGIQSNKFKETIPEKIISEFIESINIPFEKDYRSENGGLEIDVLLKGHNIGIEVDGVFWHSEKYRKNNYHIDKSLYYAHKGINILHFWDFEVLEKLEIVQDMIRTELDINTKIDASECIVQDLDVKIARDFCDEFHIKGHERSSIRKGLYYNDELIALASFSKPNNAFKEYDLELNRYCTKSGINIINGLNKLVSEIQSDKSIFSHIDLRFPNREIFKESGFKYLKTTQPDYFWFEAKGAKIHNRNVFQTGWEKMQLKKIYRVFDCGSQIYLRESK